MILILIAKYNQAAPPHWQCWDGALLCLDSCSWSSGRRPGRTRDDSCSNIIPFSYVCVIKLCRMVVFFYWCIPLPVGTPSLCLDRGTWVWICVRKVIEVRLSFRRGSWQHKPRKKLGGDRDLRQMYWTRRARPTASMRIQASWWSGHEDYHQHHLNHHHSPDD